MRLCPEMEAERRGPKAGLSAEAPAASPPGPRPSPHSLEALGGPERPRGHAPGRAGARVPTHAAPCAPSRVSGRSNPLRAPRQRPPAPPEPRAGGSVLPPPVPRPDRRRWTRGARRPSGGQALRACWFISST